MNGVRVVLVFVDWRLCSVNIMALEAVLVNRLFLQPLATRPIFLSGQPDSTLLFSVVAHLKVSRTATLGRTNYLLSDCKVSRR